MAFAAGKYINRNTVKQMLEHILGMEFMHALIYHSIHRSEWLKETRGCQLVDYVCAGIYGRRDRWMLGCKQKSFHSLSHFR
jgi:hypothetical protein